MAATHMVLHGGYGQFSLPDGQKRRLVTQGFLKRRDSSGSRRIRVLSILHPRQLSIPCGIWEGYTMEDGFQLLISPLHLVVGLRVETRGQTDLGPLFQTKLLVHPRSEPWSQTISYGIPCKWNIWLMSNLAISKAAGRQSNKVSRLGKPISYGEDGGVTWRRWQACDEVQSNVWPRPLGGRQWSDQARRHGVRHLVLSTNRAGRYIFLSIFNQWQPPKQMLEELGCAVLTWVKDLTPDCCGNVQPVGGTRPRVKFMLLCLPVQPLYLPGQGIHNGCKGRMGFSFSSDSWCRRKTTPTWLAGHLAAFRYGQVLLIRPDQDQVLTALHQCHHSSRGSFMANSSQSPTS